MQEINDVIPKLYSFEDAGKLLALSHWTLRKWAKENKLPTVKLGTRVLIRGTDIDRLVAEGLDSLTLGEAA